MEVRRHTEAGEVSRWIPLAKNSLRPYLPSKDHTLTYNRALGGARSSVDIDKVGSFGDKEADGSFLAECTKMSMTDFESYFFFSFFFCNTLSSTLSCSVCRSCSVFLVDIKHEIDRTFLYILFSYNPIIIDFHPLDLPVHGYYNPTAERSPRRRTFDALDNRSDSITSSGKVKWLPIIARNSVTASSNYRSDSYIPLEEESLYRSNLASSNKQASTGRSMSADVSYYRRDSASRWNERCVNFGEQSRGLISYRWMPETGISMSRYIPSPLVHRRTSEGDRITAKPTAGTRWMTYSKNPSPCPIQRKLSERRSSGPEQPGATESSSSSTGGAAEPVKIIEEAKSPVDQDEDRPAKREEITGWQPVRRFTEPGQQQKPNAQGVVHMEFIKTR